MRRLKVVEKERSQPCEFCGRPSRKIHVLEGRLGTLFEVCQLCWANARAGYGLTDEIEKEKG